MTHNKTDAEIKEERINRRRESLRRHRNRKNGFPEDRPVRPYTNLSGMSEDEIKEYKKQQKRINNQKYYELKIKNKI